MCKAAPKQTQPSSALFAQTQIELNGLLSASVNNFLLTLTDIEVLVLKSEISNSLGKETTSEFYLCRHVDTVKRNFNWIFNLFTSNDKLVMDVRVRMKIEKLFKRKNRTRPNLTLLYQIFFFFYILFSNKFVEKKSFLKLFFFCLWCFKWT